MARLIDADELIHSICRKCNDVNYDEPCEPSDCAFYYAVHDAPTVDAVPVVRCKNCIYYQETIGKDSGKPCGYGSCRVPGHITGIVYDEDFCSYGERKSYG